MTGDRDRLGYPMFLDNMLKEKNLLNNLAERTNKAGN
jgi:hypothetical protein